MHCQLRIEWGLLLVAVRVWISCNTPLQKAAHPNKHVASQNLRLAV